MAEGNGLEAEPEDETMTEITTLSALADRYAAAKAASEAIEAELKALRKEILATGRETIEGGHCFLKVQLMEQTRLDTDAVKAFLGDRVGEFSKTIVIEKIAVKAKVPVAA